MPCGHTTSLLAEMMSIKMRMARGRQGRDETTTDIRVSKSIIFVKWL